MKYFKYTLIFAGAALLLSSCGNLSISQKRYSRGLNIAWFSGKDEKKVEPKQKSKEDKAAKNVPPSEEITAIDGTEEITVVGNPETTVEAPFKQEEVKQTRPAGKKQSGKRVLNTLRTIAKISPVNLSKQSHLNRPKGSKESNESDTNMIILVLLALFIPPLAVYLYYGEINTQFWISIVLCILGGGLYGSLGYIGFGFASIHALLVIFGIFG